MRMGYIYSATSWLDYFLLSLWLMRMEHEDLF